MCTLCRSTLLFLNFVHFVFCFSDIITLDSYSISSSTDITLDSDGIAWPDDLDVKFAQVDGFVSSEVTDTSLNCTEVLGSDYEDCSSYTDGNTTYYYWYPDDDSVQYLYETFPDIVNPIEGVLNEHFIVWMRTAGLPYFRKLYGKFDNDFSAGDVLNFEVNLNFDVTSFDGAKALVLTTLTEVGGQNYALGYSYVIAGSVSLFIGVLFALKRLIKPRPLGDIRQLHWNA